MTRGRLTGGVAALVLLGAYAALRLEVSTDVTEFLALNDGADRARLSRRLARSELTRTLIITVGGASEARRLAAAGELASFARAHPEVAWVQDRVPEGLERAFYELYFPRRLLFFDDRPERIPAALSSTSLARAARDLKRRLAGPVGDFLKRTAPADPLQAFPALLERLQAASEGGLTVTAEGRFVAGDWAVVFLATRSSAFASARQRPLLAALERRFAALKAADPSLRLEMSGVNRMAIANEESIKADVTRISLLSTLGIAVLFLLLFRALRPLALGYLPLVSGVLAATAVSLLLFRKVHGITLAFGSSLLGVCIDYPVHLLNHHALRPRGRALARVWPGLRLGALTTVAGFAGLLFTGFPGIREIAVFGVSGVLAALVATRVLCAPLLPPARRATPLQRALATGLSGLSRWLAASRWRARTPLLAALALCALGLPRVRWLDDPRALYDADTPLAREQRRVRDRVARVDGARVVVALGRTLEEALRRNDEAHFRLRAAEEEGLLRSHRSLHSFLWSTDLQRRNAAAIWNDAGLAQRVEECFAAEGFRPGAFRPFFEALRASPPEPLTLPELLASPLAPLVRGFVVDLEGEVGVLTFLRGVRDGPALEQRFADAPGIHYVDQHLILGRAYRSYREELTWLVGLGLGAVLALLFLRYRSLRGVLAAFVPSLLAAACAVAVLALCGATLHLLHLTALLLVLSIGADYGIFLVEARDDVEDLGAAALGVCVACGTTLLAFGLLALSEAPVLRAIGSTVGVGVLSALALAPAARVVFGSRREVPCSTSS